MFAYKIHSDNVHQTQLVFGCSANHTSIGEIYINKEFTSKILKIGDNNVMMTDENVHIFINIIHIIYARFN